MKDVEKTPAVFLDRDGTLIREIGYLSNPSDIEIINGAAEAVIKINQFNWKAVIISNQAGVARGYFTEKNVHEVNEKVEQQFRSLGASLDGIYYCPHHPDGYPPYNISCNCRKPAPGMILEAAKELNIDTEKSVVIGDKYTDVLTGLNLGISGILVLTGYGKEQKDKYEKKWELRPTYIAHNLRKAVNWWFEVQINRRTDIES